MRVGEVRPGVAEADAGAARRQPLVVDEEGLIDGVAVDLVGEHVPRHEHPPGAALVRAPSVVAVRARTAEVPTSVMDGVDPAVGGLQTRAGAQQIEDLDLGGVVEPGDRLAVGDLVELGGGELVGVLGTK